MRKIYILYSCDAYGCYASMRTVIATASIRKLKKELKTQVKVGNMEIENDYMFKDWLNGNYIGCSHSQLNDILRYGSLEVWED